jgi:hypothetical protein
MAEREAMLKKAETLAWCYARQAARDATVTVTKRFPSARQAMRETHESQSASMSRDWQDYIRRQLDKRDRVMSRAVAQVLIEEERQREALGQRVATLEAEIAELRNRLDQERGRRGLKAVLTDGAQIA